MIVNTYTSKVTRHEKLSLSLDLIELELIEPNEIIFESGQYIAIILPDKKGLRSYSISSPEQNKIKIELTINIYDVTLGGDGVHYLKNLQIGDEVVFKGPFGRLNLNDTHILTPDNHLNPEVTEVIWIGTGSGVAPMKSMLEFLNAVAVNCEDDRLRNLKNALYIGARFNGDICYFEELRKFEQLNPNFKFKYCLSKLNTPENQGDSNLPDGYLFPGYVTDQILADTADYYQRDHIHVFASGKTSTIQNILTQLENNGFSRANFHIENYG